MENTNAVILAAAAGLVGYSFAAKPDQSLMVVDKLGQLDKELALISARLDNINSSGGKDDLELDLSFLRDSFAIISTKLDDIRSLVTELNGVKPPESTGSNQDVMKPALEFMAEVRNNLSDLQSKASISEALLVEVRDHMSTTDVKMEFDKLSAQLSSVDGRL